MHHHNHTQTPIYVCPMHPEITADTPGRCRECGMALVPAPRASSPSMHEHNRHAGHDPSSFLVKFAVAVIITIPIFFYSELASVVFDIHSPAFPGSPYILLALSSIIFFYCGFVFLAGAYREIRGRMPGMMTLIALAISAAYAYSFFSILFGTGHDLLFELSSLISIMLLGHWIEMRSVHGAKGALRELAKILPDQAEVIRDGRTFSIPLSELRVGDMIQVRPGAKIPADGRIIEGQSELNESVITGESKPVGKSAGEEVIAGSLNGDGGLKIKVEKIGENTFLSGVMRLVAEAEASKSRLQILSDRVAFYLTIIALVVGAITFAAWLLLSAGFVTATERLVAVLVIACPHALGLAVPLVAAISTTLAARNGLLVRDRLALESARNITTVLFDKTGTLTRGEFGVAAIIPTEGAGAHAEAHVLLLGASVNALSEHPLAKALINEARARNISLSEVSNFARIPGVGAKGMIKGQEIFVGSSRLLEETNIKLSVEHQKKIETLASEGKTIIHVLSKGTLIGSIALADIIREGSKEAVRALRDLGIRTAMITGDAPETAAFVAQELGLDEYFAKVLPNQKAEKVKLLQSRGEKVAMTGDGVNDAPALAAADLGIAIGAGTNIAIESAGIVLVRSEPKDIPRILRLSRFTYQKMIQNIFWATGYNIVAIPLAAGVLASKGIILAPWFAAILMSASTVIVALNATLLARRKI